VRVNGCAVGSCYPLRIVPSTAYFLCPDENRPYGGVRVIYRFVDTLNTVGLKAAVVHKAAEFRCTWFENSTRVVSASSVHFEKGDLFVMPEWYRELVPRLAPGVPHIVFNQNAYETFTGLNFQVGSPPNLISSDTLGIVTVSEDNRRYLEMCFPRIRIDRIKLGIDTDLFREAASGKSKTIAFMPRKRLKELLQILHILGLRDSLKGWEFTQIEGLTEVQTAQALGKSAIFLGLNEREGFGLPSLEAMASGCIVVGFHGGVGLEYMRPGTSIPIPDGEITTFVSELESVLARWGNDETLGTMARDAAELVRREYSCDSESAQVIGVFGGALDRVRDVEPGTPSIKCDLLPS